MSRQKLMFVLVIAVIILAILSLCAGQEWILPWRISKDSPDAWILSDLRAPRTVLAFSVGAVLGLSGAVLQGLTRNPIADSGVLGISACAALGSVTAIFFNLHLLHPLAISIAGIAGAALGLAILGLFLQRTSSIVGFLLSGVMLSSLAGAATALMIALAPNPFASSEIVTWLMGSLTDRSWQEVNFALPFMAIGTLLLLLTGRALDALSLGESVAHSLGISVPRTQLIILLGVALAVGSVVAVCGIIGFVGLIIPHVMRRVAGETPSSLIIPSGLGGGALLLAADTLVRLLPTASELRLGILLSIIGAPVFLIILMKQQRHVP
jgi:iron complex transport system permease protein